MPFVSTIIAKLLALHDWYLGQWVDVSLITQGSANGCWNFYIVNASVNPCGQEFLHLQVLEEWIELLAATQILIPSLFTS